MGIRERIAVFIAPEWAEAMRMERKKMDVLRADTCMANLKAKLARDALQAIISRANTKSPNSTVKALAKIAEEALK